MRKKNAKKQAKNELHGPGPKRHKSDRQAERANVVQGFFMAAQAGYGFVRTHRPGWPDVFIPRDLVGPAQACDWVEVGLSNHVDLRKITPDSRISGRIRRVLQRTDPSRLVDGSGEDMQLIIRQFGAPGEFPDEALAEAAAAPQQVSPAEAQSPGRRDRRELPLVTIDGVDSRDFDDAVFCQRLENGNFFLSVQIADVAHYVPLHSALEKEAYARATSIYLPDRVLPMLPKQLSNGICSLNAGQDRLALACDMEFGPRGRLVKHEIYQSVIRVQQRLDYNTVNAALLDDDPQAQAKLGPALPMLRDLAALQQILAAYRHRRGALDFDFPELKVYLDEQGKVADVRQRRSRLAEKMIEQAMLAANECVAEHFFRLGQPLVFRVHEGPNADRLLALNEALLALHLEPLPADGDFNPKAMQKLLHSVEGLPTAEFVQVMALRSMSHASYAPKRSLHFGLAAKFYCHFTSPIRRYPDLLVHRVIKNALTAGLPANSGEDLLPRREKRWPAYVEAAAVQSSERELRAEEIERAAVKLKCCLFMQDKIGQQFAAKVSGVTAKGVFVALENGIEGRIALESLPADSYEYLETLLMLRGREHSYALGDAVQVRLTAVDLLERRLNFEEVSQ